MTTPVCYYNEKHYYSFYLLELKSFSFQRTSMLYSKKSEKSGEVI